jgi:hypothetical protein
MASAPNYAEPVLLEERKSESATVPIKKNCCLAVTAKKPN